MLDCDTDVTTCADCTCSRGLFKGKHSEEPSFRRVRLGRHNDDEDNQEQKSKKKEEVSEFSERIQPFLNGVDFASPPWKHNNRVESAVQFKVATRVSTLHSCSAQYNHHRTQVEDFCLRSRLTV